MVWSFYETGGLPVPLESHVMPTAMTEEHVAQHVLGAITDWVSTLGTYPDYIYLGADLFRAIGGFGDKGHVMFAEIIRHNLSEEGTDLSNKLFCFLHTGRSDAVILGDRYEFTYPTEPTGTDTEDSDDVRAAAG